MIGPEDIEAFAEKARVDEGVRRYRKGLPEDRWHDGVNGHAAFMRAAGRLSAAYVAQHELIKEMTGMMAEMLSDLQSRGAESMEPHRDPCRNDKV